MRCFKRRSCFSLEWGDLKLDVSGLCLGGRLQEGRRMAEKKKKSWIIVTNKKTYLFLAAALCCAAFLAGDAVYVFVLKQREIVDFAGDLIKCLVISLICIYFFVRFNTYSHLFNPEHPKPEYGKEDE